MEALTEASVETILLTSSDGRDITVGTSRHRTTMFDLKALQEFRPEVVLNTAFLTRARLGEVGTEEFIRVNRQLTAQFFACASLPTVRMALTVSSGAIHLDAHDSSANPYGNLKLEEEEAVQRLIENDVDCCIARAWSLSGTHVVRPRDYAFSDLILQALRVGRIAVRSRGEVWRRYTDAQRFLTASIAGLHRQGVRVLESGGVLTEVRELALLIGEAHRAEVFSNSPTGEIDFYASDGEQYADMCDFLGMAPDSLMNQIRAVSCALGRRLGSHAEP